MEEKEFLFKYPGFPVEIRSDRERIAPIRVYADDFRKVSCGTNTDSKTGITDDQVRIEFGDMKIVLSGLNSPEEALKLSNIIYIQFKFLTMMYIVSMNILKEIEKNPDRELWDHIFTTMATPEAFTRSFNIEGYQ